MTRPHLLYLAFWFPPSRASGVYRALATTNAFVDAGWEVTVVTTTERFLEEEIGSTDPTLVDLIPDSARDSANKKLMKRIVSVVKEEGIRL